MRVLIADDDPISRRLLQATLARLDYDVVSVDDGSQARDVLTGDDPPRLAILDWMMPGVDGLELCRLARARTGAYIYVILLTARSRREDLVAGLGAEADDFLTKPFDFFELQARLRSGTRIIQLEQRLLQAQDALRHEATHDHLTGAWNRRRALEHLEVEWQRAARQRAPVTVALFDVDHFKTINDRFGHPAGDEVLRGVVDRVQSVLRAGARLGRYGGEEFLVVLPDCGADAAVPAAERLRHAIADAPFAIDGHPPLAVRVSIGVSTGTGGEGDAAALIQSADRALYRAKRAGRDRVDAEPGRGAGYSVIA